MMQTDPKVHVQTNPNLSRLGHFSDWQVEILGLVYVVFIPSHSLGTLVTPNPSLSLITHTTHSTSGLGLPEWLICRAFFIAVI